MTAKWEPLTLGEPRPEVTQLLLLPMDGDELIRLFDADQHRQWIAAYALQEGGGSGIVARTVPLHLMRLLLICELEAHRDLAD
jgi:hypothetical protein